MKSFEGLITALVTPFRDGAVDREAYRRLVDRQIGAGATGVVPAGSTGESATLTYDDHFLCVDLAVEAGGNVEGAVAGDVVTIHGVKVVGHRNVAGRLAADASALFARNLFNFLSAFWDKESGKPVLDEEIGDAVRLTKDGAVVNARLLG